LSRPSWPSATAPEAKPTANQGWPRCGGDPSRCEGRTLRVATLTKPRRDRGPWVAARAAGRLVRGDRAAPPGPRIQHESGLSSAGQAEPAGEKNKPPGWQPGRWAVDRLGSHPELSGTAHQGERAPPVEDREQGKIQAVMSSGSRAERSTRLNQPTSSRWLRKKGRATSRQARFHAPRESVPTPRQAEAERQSATSSSWGIHVEPVQDFPSSIARSAATGLSPWIAEGLARSARICQGAAGPATALPGPGPDSKSGERPALIAFH